MDGTQFMVQWDEHPSHLATRLGYLLEHQSLVDVTLMCNTHTLKVHKAVLAACSPYFERQLGNHPLIVLKDMKFSVLKSLVEFMYCGETSVSEENLSPLLEAAKFFEVKGLSTMTKETVCTPSTSPGVKTCNGTSISSGFSRGGGRGRGRGRGRPPLNQPSTSSSKIGSPTESAQILLSLSGNSPSPQILNTKSILSDGKIPPKLIYEPRRRGRKRGALNSAFRDKLLREVDTQMTIENLKRDLTEDGDPTSPLLTSLLTKPDKLNSTFNDKKSPYIIKALQKGEEKTKETLNDEMIMTLKNGAETEAEVEPEAVVLFEVRDNKKVDKHVVSAKDISLLKSLNEQLTNQKKELGDLMASLNLVDNDVNITDQIEDLKNRISKTKQMLSQLVGYSKDKIVEKKSQMVQLEFLDGNGEKIEGYQVQGTYVDKKESKDEFLGLFDICDNQNQSPLLAAENVAVDKEKLDQAYQLEDNTENISYEIEAMMNDSSNIVIEDKNQDYKYIIDNDGTMMNQEDNYVVYESVETGNAIYDGGQGVLTDIGEGSGEDYVVGDNQVIEDSGEYVVYDKEPMNDISEQQEYIMYNDEKQQENLIIYQSSDRLDVKEEIIPLDELSQEENCIPNKFSLSNFHSDHKYRKSDMKRRLSSASDSSNSSIGKKLRPDPTLAQGEESL